MQRARLHMRTLAGAVFAGMSLLACGPLRAGSVEGPYLLWFNLSAADTRHADEQIKAFVNGEQRLCWPDGALLYMRDKPHDIDAALVRRALERGDPAAQRRLRTLLRKPFGEVSGFDGIVAYSDRKQPTLIALPMKGRLRSEALRSPTGEDAWGATFCRVMPPISRAP